MVEFLEVVQEGEQTLYGREWSLGKMGMCIFLILLATRNFGVANAAPDDKKNNEENMVDD